VGKNSTDSALIIDAMDLLYAGHLDGFVIVSSDSDFTRLATRLRESGMTVYGLGAKKTPRAFRDACDKFTFLEVLRADTHQPGSTTPDVVVPEMAETTSPEPTRDAKSGNLQSMLTKALNKTATDDDWSALGALGSHLNRTDPSFDSRTYGFAKLSDLVKDQPFLETKTVEADSGQGQLWVRQKGRTAARKSPAAAKKPAPEEPAAEKPEQLADEKPALEKPAPKKAAAENSAPKKPAAEPAKKTTTARRRTTRKTPQPSEGGV